MKRWMAGAAVFGMVLGLTVGAASAADGVGGR